jgi:hypothetical protein
MRTKLFFLLTALVALTICSDAYSWGAAHIGYTHVGPSGVYHYGHNAAVGPYGAYSGAHVSHYGGYGGRTAYGNAIHSASHPYGGGYAAGGFRTGGVYGGYRAGAYRRW